MLLVLFSVLFLSLATLLLLAAWWGIRVMVKGPRPGYWRRALVAVLLLIPVHALVTLPAVLGALAIHALGTRPDERAYAGPELDAAGVLQPRGPKSLANVPPPADPFAHPNAVPLEVADGLTLRGFLIPAVQQPARFQAVLLHGLFRNALELEPVAAWLQELGGDCLLVEHRNHGYSDDAPATFGLRESVDVERVVAWLRARDERAASRPTLLMGVSLGTAYTMLAAPRIPRLAGLLVDAPMDDLTATLHREARVKLGMVTPWPSLLQHSIGLWGGFDLSDVRPGDSLEQLAAETAVLMVGEELDRRMPEDSVRNLFQRLPQGEADRKLWICPGATHGSAWQTDPEGYRERLSWWVERSLASPLPR